MMDARSKPKRWSSRSFPMRPSFVDVARSLQAGDMIERANSILVKVADGRPCRRHGVRDHRQIDVF